MAGTASIATDGLSPVLFAAFAVTFPLVVFLTFVWLVVKHPGNLYSPGQYTPDTNVEAYTHALGPQVEFLKAFYSRAAANAATEVTHSAIASQGELGAAREPSGDDVRAQVEQEFGRLVDEGSVNVDPGLLVGMEANDLPVPVGLETTVDAFLDAVYFALDGRVRPFTYGKSWVLADEDLKPYADMGTQWAKGHGRNRDNRLLSQVGIKAGDRLHAVPTPASQSSEPQHRNAYG